MELQTQMKDVQSDVADIKQGQEDGFKDILNKFTELEKGLEKKYAHKSELKTFKWVTLPVALIATTVLTFLITYFLQNISKKGTANNPTTSETTTTTTPTGSTGTTTTRDGTPSATANASAQSGSDKDSESAVDGVVNQVPKVLTP